MPNATLHNFKQEREVMGPRKLPSVDFEDEEFLGTFLRLVEEHRILSKDKHMTLEAKWELVVEDLYTALDPQKFRPCATANLSKAFRSYKKTIESQYEDFINDESTGPIDSEQIPDPFHLRFVNMIRKYELGREDIDTVYDKIGEDDGFKPRLNRTDKYKQVHFQVADEDSGDNAYFFEQLLSSPKDSLLEGAIPPRAHFVTKQNTLANAGAKRDRVTNGQEQSAKKVKVLLASPLGSEEPTDSKHRKEEPKNTSSTVHAKNSTMKPEDDPYRTPSVIEKQLELKVQEAKNQGKAIELEIEKMGIEKLKQQIRLQAMLNP
eukprot:gene39303-47836_t